MDNNLLTYILTTLNVDALGHHWVAALAGYNMKLEYLKGSDNKVVDALSRVSTQVRRGNHYRAPQLCLEQ